METQDKIEFLKSEYEDKNVIDLIINFEKLMKIYVQLELAYTETVDNRIFELEPLLFNISRNIYRIKLESMYLLNSVKYYIGETRRWIKQYTNNDNLNNSRSSRSDKSYRMKLLGLFKLTIASFYNLANSLYENENISRLSSLRYLSVFESSPIDKNLLDFDSEVENIESIAYESLKYSGYYPIVRYATNKNIFEKTVLEFKPEIYHFVCHGDEKILCFIGPGGKSESFESLKFINFLNANLNYDIRLIYLNACDSMSYASELRRNKRKPVRIYKTIGYMGENFNSKATSFSKGFYSELLKYNEIKVCQSFQIAKSNFLKRDPDFSKEIYMKKIRVCKR